MGSRAADSQFSNEWTKECPGLWKERSIHSSRAPPERMAHRLELFDSLWFLAKVILFKVAFFLLFVSSTRSKGVSLDKTSARPFNFALIYFELVFETAHFLTNDSVTRCGPCDTQLFISTNETHLPRLPRALNSNNLSKKVSYQLRMKRIFVISSHHVFPICRGRSM